MKINDLKIRLFILFGVILLVLNACGKKPDDINDPKKNPTDTIIGMIRVPGAAKFPTGLDDLDDTVKYCTSVNYPYLMAKYEITYEVWTTVYNWATDEARGADKYSFWGGEQCGAQLKEGQPASSFPVTSENASQPVCNVSWPDALLWCNALTEYYNAKNGTNWECVYKFNNETLRNPNNSAMYDMMPGNIAAKGFRLPSGMEWELAARYLGGTNWTKGTCASGSSGSIITRGWRTSSGGTTFWGLVVNKNLDPLREVSWFWDNPTNSGSGGTHPAGQKKPNALGIYDMSGNVWEWTTDIFSTGSRHPLPRGGCWDWKDMADLDEFPHLAYLAVGWQINLPNWNERSMGFRPVRTE
jgi:formylglycine-generating enzyme required for sulfatase activity